MLTQLLLLFWLFQPCISVFPWLFDLFWEHSFQLLSLFCRNLGRVSHTNLEEWCVRFWLAAELANWGRRAEVRGIQWQALQILFKCSLLLLLLILLAVSLCCSSDIHHQLVYCCCCYTRVQYYGLNRAATALLHLRFVCLIANWLALMCSMFLPVALLAVPTLLTVHMYNHADLPLWDAAAPLWFFGALDLSWSLQMHIPKDALLCRAW